MAAAAATGSTLQNVTDNQKRWLVFGIALNKVMVTQIRSFVEQEVRKEHGNLQRSHSIHTQSTSGRLKNWPAFLKYENINGNNVLSRPPGGRYDYSKFDCRVISHVDFAKLYVENHMAKFNAFDEHCDASAVLTLLGKVPVFSWLVQSSAGDVRQARNAWAHCVFSDWDPLSFQQRFANMEKLVKSLGLPSADEMYLVNELKDWETKGATLCMNATIDPDLVKTVQQDLNALKNDMDKLAFEEEVNRENVKKALHDFQLVLEELTERVARVEHEQEVITQEQEVIKQDQSSLCDKVNTAQDQISELKSEQEDLRRHVTCLEDQQKSKQPQINHGIANCESDIAFSAERSDRWFSDQGDSRAYVLRGDPGVGKGVLAGVLARHGSGNTVNTYGRRLEFGERSPTSGLREAGFRTTAIQDGGAGEWRGMKRKQSKIRFPQRKRRPRPQLYPKRGSSESDEEIVRYNSPEIFPAASGDSKQKTSQFCVVLNILHPLRDSGNWKDFNSVADGIIKTHQGDPAIKLLILIEKSVVASYQNNLESAVAMVLKVLKTLKKTTGVEMSNFLVIMAHVHLTGFYRRQNKHGKAEDSIAIAEQNSRNENSRFLRALIFYEKASNLTKFVSSITRDRSARKEYVERAKCFMKECIELCIELDDGNVYIKKHHFGLVKLVLLDLNCRTKAARSQITCRGATEEARNCLKTIEERFADEMKEGQKIQFLVARCDLNYRQKNFQAALKYAHSALDLAKDHGFSLEITAIKERQNEISELITTTETLNLGIPQSGEHVDSLSSSTAPSRRNSPYSSGCEME